jgi:Zn-dependent protease
VGLILLKFKSFLLPALKFIPALLKTGGSMFLTIWLYAMVWGWAFAAGFVILIFIHELGHVLAARQVGVKVTAPVFIPFVGALILLKEAPQNAWAESKIAIGGPLLGSIGAAVCYLLYPLTGNALFAALAYTGFFLNLFNLAPLTPLDGGRIVTALSPWLWLVGLLILGGLMFLHFNFIILLVILMSLPRLFSLFRGKTVEEINYFQVTPAQRWIMGTLYIGLAVLLTIAMSGIPGQIAHHVTR